MTTSAGRDLVKKTEIYRAQTTPSDYHLFFQKATDVKCYVNKNVQGHYLFKDTPPEFIVDSNNLWDPHPVRTTNINIVKQKFESMAESNRGPLIALHQNSCCC